MTVLVIVKWIKDLSGWDEEDDRLCEGEVEEMTDFVRVKWRREQFFRVKLRRRQTL